MCFSAPAMPTPPPPAPPPPPPSPSAEKALTQRQAQTEPKKKRGTTQLTTRRPTIGSGMSRGETGVNLPT